MKPFIALALALVFAVPAHADSRLVILRGDAGGNQPLEFVADETTLEQAKLAGISGAELLALKGQRLLEQADIYRAAQRTANPAPLYVVLEPTGTWAYASPWGTFRYERDGKKIGPVTTPYLKLGEAMDHRGQAVDPGEESAAANRTLIQKARAFYEAELKAKGVKRIPDFERDVLDRLTVSTGGPYVGLSKAAASLSTERFLGYLQRTLESELTSYRLDGKARWAAFTESAGTAAIAAETSRTMLKRGVAETVAHELGHVIQFAALGLYEYKGATLGVHMKDNGHTLQTLSTPEFALVEGWGEANSMVVVGLPRERTPGEANRINYGTTAASIPQVINERAGRLVSARMHRDNLLKAEEPLTTPWVGMEPEKFRTGLRDTALKAGMKQAEWDALAAELDRDPELKDLARANTYVASLQARQGQLRSRYDFLRSEYAVANALARLREALGLDAAREVCETLGRRKSRDLASLIESYVHDFPARRLDTYRVLAQATEGILVTPAQVAAIEEAERAGRTLEIDFDQDGRVPGTSANAALPQAFPRDMPDQDPLPLAGTRGTQAAAPIAQSADETAVLAPPTGDRTIPTAVEPDMDGLERN